MTPLPCRRLTIGALLDSCVRSDAGRDAATLDRESITFRDLDREANRFAHALQGLGVSSGDFVAWWSGTALRTLAGFVGCARLGAVFVPLNPAFNPAETSAVLDYVQPRLLVCDPERAAIAEPLLAAGGITLATFGGAGGAVPGVDMDALVAAARDAAPADDVDDSLPHILYLTSGSTGTPKGALVSHRASWLRSSCGGGTFTAGLRGSGGVVSAFPLFHYGGWHYVLEAWHNRRPIHLVPRATAEHLTAAVQTWRASALYAIPAVWERILGGAAPDWDASSLRHADTGTSATPLTLLERIKELLPHTTTSVLYGSTEGGRMACLDDSELRERPGSVGRPAAPGSLWIADDGEVCFASPGLMDGYLHLPELTEATLAGGYYHSGDVGYVDDDGYLYLTGRTKELIRTGGESVWPVEVEQALRDRLGVSDFAVIGIPDAQWGEVVCLAVVPSDGPRGTAPDVEHVRGLLTDRLAAFKHPRLVRTVSEIPRTAATGQVQRRALSDAVVRLS